MAELTDVEALSKISTVVDESQIKVILSKQCLKAQAFLVEKLKIESDRYKETCNFLSTANRKLEYEIKQAEEEIRSLLIAQDTIKLANVELKKELLLAKEKKLEIVERVQVGENKYEKLWLECKNRYESIPFVQKLLQAKTRCHALNDNIDNLEIHSQTLLKEINTKRNVCLELDRKHIIELAQFLVHEMPNNIQIINETTSKIYDLAKEIDEIIKVQESENEIYVAPLEHVQNIAPTSEGIKKTIIGNENWINLSISGNNETLMPKLLLVNYDLEVISDKIEQVIYPKIKKVDMQVSTTPVKTGPVVKNIIEKINKSYWKEEKCDNYISSYFNNVSVVGESENKSQNYSKMKLINILEDIKIDKNGAMNILSRTNVGKLHTVNVIHADIFAHKHVDSSEVVMDKTMKIEVIEDIDLTPNVDNILNPPTPFSDRTMDKDFGYLEPQDAEVDVPISPSAENFNLAEPKDGKKRVSFDLPTPMQLDNTMNDDTHNPEELVETNTRLTIISKPDKSAANEQNFMKIKDIILKKHNLDCSPEFVYTKSSVQMNIDRKVVTSKFFSNKDKLVSDNEMTRELDGTKKLNEIRETDEDLIENYSQVIVGTQENMADDNVQVDVIEPAASDDKSEQPQQREKPLNGFLFTHGAQVIPDSLDISISTTGYEEGDADFPHCIDSSLLMSPKADLPMPLSGDNADIKSQEVPNFLSGIRKTGLSFFGLGSSESKPDSSGQNKANNFSFNFGGEEKKNRSGLFSMFQ